MDKREAVLRLLDSGSPQTYVPAAFFLHFDRQFHAGPAAVEKHKEFFRSTGMDFVKIQFEVAFPQSAVNQPSDWSKLPPLGLDFFEPQLGVVRGLVKELGREAPVVLTLYSPMMIAGHMGGEETLTRHLREDPEAVAPGLKKVTDDLARFVEECVRIGLDGFYHSTQGGEDRRFEDRSIFTKYVKSTDLRAIESAADCRFNILHICDYNRDSFGGYRSLEPFLDYPGHVVNCNPEGQSLKQVAALFGRPFMGGMERKGVLSKGSEEEVRQEARRVLAERPDRFILGADCTVPGDTPWGNLRAAIEEAHRA
ncbi:MAG TPA: uroporphyrinogen decarboxylase family protein [Fimbriimonas sp.]